MPEAESFNALGAGNGFTECLTKVDVSGFDYWQTLGGFKKTDGGSPSQSQISESLSVAMALLWNLNGVDSSYSGFFDAELVIDGDAGQYTTISWDKIAGGSTSSNVIPKDRVCYTGGDLSLSESFAFGGCSVSTSSTSIIRMYEGVTTDEGNFIGYGAGAFTMSSFDAIFSNAYFTLSSTVNLVSSPPNIASESAEYVTFGSTLAIPIVAHLFETDFSGGSVTATVSQSGSSVIGEFETSGGTTETFTYNSLDFYTYPA